MLKKKLYLLLIVGATMLSGCSNSTSVDMNASSSYYSTNGVELRSMESASVYDEDAANYETEADIVKNTMMIARDASLSVDVKNLENFDSDLHSKVEEYGGYFENASVDSYNSAYSTDRYAYYTIRIPQTKLDDFLGIVDGESTVTSKTVTSEDLSLSYADIKAHISALENEKKNLQRLMDQTESVSEIIEIEDRLSSVQYNLDSINEQKRLLEGRVSYSSVNINAHEERNIEHPIAMAFEINFAEEFISSIEEAVSVLVGIITSIPVIIIVTAFVLLFIWILRKIWRKIFKKDKKIKYMLVPVGVDIEGCDIVEKAPRVKEKDVSAETNSEQDK